MNYSDQELRNYVTDIATEFYSQIFENPWFKKLFVNTTQEIITNQQIDFMLGALGGPNMYGGRSPKDAHPHVWINEDIWNYREKLLLETFNKVKTPQVIQDKWLTIENAFRRAIINEGGPETCQGRYKTEAIIYEPLPENLKRTL
jgi:hemoglobin